MSNLAVQAAISPESLPAELLELSLDFALVLQKVAMYPGGHPMLRGAVDALVARMQQIAESWGSVTIAVTSDQILIEGCVADSANPLLREFAAHLRAHQLAAIRILPGADIAEVEDLMATLATPARRVDRPLGTLGDDMLYRWRHVALYPLTFDALELRGESSGGTDAARAAVEVNRIWADLTRAALGGGTHAEATPANIAESISRRAESATYSQEVFGAISRAAGELRGHASPLVTAMRVKLSDLVASMSPDALARLLKLGAAGNLRVQFLRESAEVLNARALVNLVAAEATAAGKAISQSMMRLLTKLSQNAAGGNTPEVGADGELCDVLARLTEQWTLSDPNPEAYASVLTHMSRRGAADGIADQGRDQVEPDRVVELSIEAGRAGEATGYALARMIGDLGLAGALDRLTEYPPSPVRDAMIDSLVNADILVEQLAGDFPDQRVMHHAVSRLRGEAVEPLLHAVETRADGNTDFIADLLVAVGAAAVPLLEARLRTSERRVQHVILTIFDRLEAWPDTAYLKELGRHPDATLRREAVRLMLKHEVLRDDAIAAAISDPDEAILGLALAAALKFPTPRVAQTLMRRVDSDAHMSAELRGRAVRTIAASGAVDGMQWIVARLVTRSWFFRRLRLTRRSAETIAGLAGLAVHWSDAAEASQVLDMARQSRDGEIRRAATLKPASR